MTYQGNRGNVRSESSSGAGENTRRAPTRVKPVSRSARAIQLIAAGYTEADAAREVGITLTGLRVARAQAKPKKRRNVFRAKRIATPPEIGDADVCTDDACTIVELHRRGPRCSLMGAAKLGNRRAA